MQVVAGICAFDHSYSQVSDRGISIKDLFYDQRQNSISDKDDGREPQILIVDDEPINLIAIEGQLTAMNFDSINVGSGEEALALVNSFLEQEKPMFKLIMLDYCMPGMDGPTTSRELNKLLEVVKYKGPKPYICCLSAYSEDFYRKNALENGMHDFHTKPVCQRALIQILEASGLMPEQKHDP